MRVLPFLVLYLAATGGSSAQATVYTLGAEASFGDDFLAGAPAADVGSTNTGFAAVVSGATGNPLATWTGGSGDALGHGLSSAGDLDGDGVPDVLIGAPDAPFGAGEVS